MKNPARKAMLVLASITLYLLSSFQCHATEINVLQFAEAHTLVRATIVTEGTSYGWIVTSAKDGTAVEKQDYDGGQSIVFTGPPGVYSVIGVTIVDGKIDVGQATVTIGKPLPPDPDDNPDPDPTPKPTPDTIPDDRFNNVGKLSFQCASKLPPAAKAQAAATANLYKTAVEGLKSGELVNGTAAQNYVRVEREKIWGPNTQDWMRELSPVVEVWNAQTITKATVIEFYTALAAGLSAVK